LRYQYQLTDADAEWRELAAQRTVNFASLALGRYRFRVRAVNADGAMSAQPATVSFTVLRPVWQRWWFIRKGNHCLWQWSEYS
jgi:predicted phage tail protein